MDWMQTVEKFYKNKKSGSSFNFESLLEMVSEQMEQPLNEKKTPQATVKTRKSIIDLLPKIQISEDFGDPKTASRQVFEKYMNRVEGDGLPDKIAFINNFVEGAEDVNRDVGNVISNLIFLELLATIIQQFSPSGAGFLFEAFLAGLLRGKQVTGKVEGQLPIDDIRTFIDPETGEGGKPVSLKLLSSTTAVHGSTTNLVNFLASPDGEAGVEYVVGIKYGDKVVSFYSFTIDRDNILSWIGHNFDGQSLRNNLGTLGDLREGEIYDLPMMTERDGEEDYEEHMKRFKKEYDEVSVVVGHVDGKSPRSPAVAEETMMNAPQEMVAKFIEYGMDAGYNREEMKDLMFVHDAEGELDRRKTVLQRRKLLKAMLAKLSPKHPLGQPYSRDHSSSKDPIINKELAETMKDLSQRDPKRWATVLMRAMHEKQFHIDSKFYQTKRLPPHMRQKRYGHLELSREKIREVAESYSKILQETVLPIYEALDSFNTSLSGYFIDRDMEAGDQAVAAAAELKAQTEQRIV